MTIFFTKHKIDELTIKLSRDEILRKSRILIIDDERPELIDDLEKARFTVDYVSDISKDNLDAIERHPYNLVILDFGGVGSSFGGEQGLSILRHIKRVHPSVVVLAYTSKALTTEHADFFRLADGVLLKDLGIGESMEKIEDALIKAHDIKNLWKGLLYAAGVEASSKQDFDLQDGFVRGIDKPKKWNTIRSKFSTSLDSEIGKKAALVVFEKLCELVVKSAIGG